MYANEQKTRCRRGGSAMAKLGKPAIYGPDFSYITCLRCKTSIWIKNAGSSIKLIYDVDGWQRSTCCCSHFEGPVACCSFAELKQVIDDLRISR
jgi:hypothetical protein